MGSSSKVLLVGATSLIVGVYAISLKNVQTTGMLTAQTHVNRMQNERVVDAALILALDKVNSTGGNTNTTVTGKHALGADITYTISHANGNSATINLTITKGTFTENITATAQKISGKQKKGYRKMHRGNWGLASAFVQHG